MTVGLSMQGPTPNSTFEALISDEVLRIFTAGNHKGIVKNELLLNIEKRQ